MVGSRSYCKCFAIFISFLSSQPKTEAYLRLCETSMIEHFSENSLQLLVVNPSFHNVEKWPNIL